MKLAICGPSRCGKDTAATLIQSLTGLRFLRTTSEVIAPYVAAQLGIPAADAFARRHEDRALWRRVGDQLRRDDPAFLARRTLEDGGDICVGVRSLVEIRAVRAMGLCSLLIWVERDVPHDVTLEYDRSECDIVIDNNGSLNDLHRRLHRLARTWRLA